ncbi:hypothetical protein KOW79_001881 [Hemibagrus wyckioides]|uniref:Uncharacterized protein n=1 Tax=Hemibagrus wyckioides TaxID=337641 RepID=A0A9D3SUD1_9TELE|nr:hypothetical protein KOW79_001881 [Hemibagrus wyckioides]
MLALTSAGYCAYRWLKRSSDLQAAELQAAHGSVVDDVEEAETTEVTEINIQLRSTSLDPQKSAVILHSDSLKTK